MSEQAGSDLVAVPSWLRWSSRLINGWVERRRAGRDLSFPAASLGAVGLELPGGAVGWWLGQPTPAPAVVLGHGFGASARSMAPIAERLHGGGLHVLAVDDPALPGPDEEGRPRPRRGPGESLAEALALVRARDDVGGVALLGHSMGGSAALGLAASTAPPVQAVITLGAVGDAGDTRMSVIPAWLNRQAVAVVRRNGGPDLRAEMGAGAARRLADTPVLVVHGLADRTIPVHNAHAIAAAAPRSTLRLVDGVGHAPATLFSAVADEVTAFVHDALAAPR